MGWRGILFDLDGTLVETPQSFYTEYFEHLCAHLDDPAGAAAVRHAVRSATEAVRAEGRATDPVGSRVVAGVASCLAREPDEVASVFATFYREAYPRLGRHVRPIPGAAELVAEARRRRLVTCLASDPVFPGAQLAARLRWGGLSDGDFAWVPGADHAHALKPQPAYFEELAAHLGLDPAECLMVGNDPVRDVAAVEAGMRVFVLTGPVHAVAERAVVSGALPPGVVCGGVAEALAFIARGGV